MKKINIQSKVKASIDRENYIDDKGNQLKYKIPKRMDGGLIIIVFLMVCFGMVMLFSASMTEGFASEGNTLHFIQKQGFFTILGIFAALFIAWVFPIRKFDNIKLVIFVYVLTTFLLLSIFIPTNPIYSGVNLNGARRWIKIFSIQFQPSEAAKIALVMCFAGYTSWVKKQRAKGFLVARRLHLQSWKDAFYDIIIPSCAFVFWVLLIFLQPHISCIIIISILMFFLLLSSQISAKSWICGIIMLLAIALVFALIITIIAPVLPPKIQNYIDFNYVFERLAIFGGSDKVDQDDMLQTTQSLNAIGSGGIFGVGIGNSIQKWGYLPMQYNDYIFSIIAEELGLIGAMLIILLFCIYLILGVRIASKASSIHGLIVAFGFSILITLQAFLNIGVATKAIPPTGISLPFFSYGGTSAVFFYFAVGFLLCVSKSGVKVKNI